MPKIFALRNSLLEVQQSLQTSSSQAEAKYDLGGCFETSRQTPCFFVGQPSSVAEEEEEATLALPTATEAEEEEEEVRGLLEEAALARPRHEAKEPKTEEEEESFFALVGKESRKGRERMCNMFCYCS